MSHTEGEATPSEPAVSGQLRHHCPNFLKSQCPGSAAVLTGTEYLPCCKAGLDPLEHPLIAGYPSTITLNACQYLLFVYCLHKRRNQEGLNETGAFEEGIALRSPFCSSELSELAERKLC